MRLLMAGLLVSTIAAGVRAAQQGTGAIPQTIGGLVSDARDNAPLRRARVAVTSPGSRQEYVALTGDDGRFVLPDVPAASITVKVTKAGYAVAQVAVPRQGPGADLRVALARSAAVSGRVTDTMGPVTNAYATARLLLQDGTPGTRASDRFFVQTDRLGEYRLGGLPAGRYAVTGLRRPAGLVRGGEPGDELFGSREGLDVGRTVTLTLNPGEDVTGIDFTLPGANESCAIGPSVRPAEGAVAARLEGRVTARSGEPLPCAIVRIVSPASPVPQVYTDRQGRFVIDGLPAGTFVLTAIRSGYLSLRYGQRDPSDDEIAVTLRPGQRREDVDVTLPRESVVAGTVVDEHGEPMEGVPVSAIRVWRSNGLPFIMPIPAGRTDDRGRYRITGVPPGDYVVSARASGGVSSMSRASGYSSTYHPGTLDLATALRVPVAAGRDVEGVDVVVRSAFTATISGSVVDSSGRPFTGGVVLTPTARSGASILDSRSAQTDAAGAFIFRDVSRGDYVLKAPGGVPGDWSQFAMQYVTVLDDNPPPVRLTLAEGARLEGRFVVEAAPDVNLADLTVTFQQADPDYTPVGGFKAPIFGREPDSTFRMFGLTGPARIILSQMPGCDSCYLKAAFVNGTDTVDTPFNFGTQGGTYRDVQVVVSDAGARIQGRVLNERATASAYGVVVVSAHEELRYQGSRYSKLGQRLPDGSFRVTGLPPGDYLVAAVRRTEAYMNVAELIDADVLALVAARGTRVTLAERESAEVNLRLLRR